MELLSTKDVNKVDYSFILKQLGHVDVSVLNRRLLKMRQADLLSWDVVIIILDLTLGAL